MTPICHVQLLPLLSGVQRAMLEIFRHLDRGRYEPHVVCQGPGPLSEELNRLDIPCHFVPSLRRPIHPLHDARAYRALKTPIRQAPLSVGAYALLKARHPGPVWRPDGPACPESFTTFIPSHSTISRLP